MPTGRELEQDEYFCPGEKSPISRAVHLARLSGYYPACRACPHRDDTGTLSTRQVEHLVQSRRHAEGPALFHDEGAAGLLLNEFDAVAARRLGAAMGALLRQGQPHDAEPPAVVLAGDGRPAAHELLAAVAEGVRWTGCRLFDAGRASAPCVAMAVDHLGADGGLLLGTPLGREHAVGLKFWGSAAKPLSAGPALRQLQAFFEAEPDRPTRKFGSVKRFAAQDVYLAGPAQYYHALRPLRLVVHTTCPPTLDDLEHLTAPVACQVLQCGVRPERIGEQILEDKAHLGILIDDDGERCRVVDERGQPGSDERLLPLIARHLPENWPDGPIVVGESASSAVIAQIQDSGIPVVRSGALRSRMHEAMLEHQATFGAGAGGQLWYGQPSGHASPDAIWTVTLLLNLLSQSDRPLSAVLDACSPMP